MWDFPLFPDQASTTARQVDQVYFGLLILGGTIATLVAILLIRFAVKYRRGSRAGRPPERAHSWTIEIVWIATAMVLFIGLFLWAAQIYFSMRRPPPGTMDIYVSAKQWMWKVQHPGGQREINALHVPRGRPVKLIMTSQDVIHSFYIPAFRVKMDVLPDRYTTLWFDATRLGEYHLFCAEYCGADHSRMIGKVVVMEPAEYQAWAGPGATVDGPVPGTPGADDAPMTTRGAGAFFQLGCNACHVRDSDIRAPRLVGLFGAQVQLRNGQKITADADYIRQSILDPNARIVAGYPAPSLMPTYRNQASEQQIVDLIEYIRSLGNPGVTTPQEAQP